VESIARPLLLLLVLSSGACRHHAPARAAVPPAETLAPSPRLIPGFAFVELAADSPNAALANGTELVARTLELRETARLRVSRFVRGRTLGVTIVSGQPSAGDEVVWLAP
jgi:hypothetical protein